MNFESIIDKLRKLYPFLKGIDIDITDGYNIDGATAYRYKEKSIYVDLANLQKWYGSKRYTDRLGKCSTFREFVIRVLLHEIAHVRQFSIRPQEELIPVFLKIQGGDIESHDSCPLEIEADRWAISEFTKYQNELL